ncbi:MAG: cation-translocating P-type ATPase [Chloroflexi bacterium]|nr:cation-translocating P-type ATPase [Chloroflexota bacterium]MYD16879.1 cation-translocating P-type ATPase [Chloroflexota bacterium]MYI04981.1 cation-translocating P-type ATPase [Chloroflexota bacterium]
MVSDSRPVPPDPLDDAPPLFDLAALEEGQPPLDSETLARVSEALAEVEGRTERGWLSDWPAGPTDTAPPPLTLEPPPPLESLLDPEDDLPTTQPRRVEQSEPPNLSGLSREEVAQRVLDGRVNQDTSKQRGDVDVIVSNVFTYFNLVLFGLIGILLVLAVTERKTDHLQDAAFVGMVVLANVLVGTFQELRATRKLRQLVALTAPTATVVRGGEEAEVLATDVVEDDLVVLRSGDQVVADGPVVWAVAELDESILTGETSSVRRGPGDDLESGAFCVGGSCYYRAARVGDQSRAVRETRDARELTRTETPLQLRFKRILDGLIVATAILGLLILISFLITGREFDEAVKATIATATSVVPEGLMLGFTVAFAVGALRVSRLGAIVQDNTAVEALNYLDTICLDKTGTITANRLQVDDVRWAPGGSALVGWLGAFATSTSANNRTAQALDAAFALQSNGAESVAEEPFNSERRWSAARLRVDGEDRVFVLGAPERLLRSEGDDSDVRDELLAEYERAAERGLRGVVFAEAAAMPDAETDTLPRLRIVALITVADELRPEIANAFRMMKEFEIEPKIISGDNPATVAALIQQLGIRLDGGLISGTTLSRLKEDELADAVEENSVFGRIAPQQKEQIVAALQRNGHYVAMVGDGANDVRALRQADVGVAMESGASTAKGVASIVLRNDSFEALVQGTGIAQSVLGNASQLSKLFVTKSFYAFLIIFISNMMGLEFPFLPRHGSLTALFTLGVPAVFITLTKPPRAAGHDFLSSTMRFAIPASLALAISAVAVHLLTEGILGRPVEDARTLVSTTIGIVGLAYMVEVIGYQGATRDSLMRPALVTFFGVALLGAFILTLYTPPLRNFFDFSPLSAAEWAIIAFAVTFAMVGKWALSTYAEQIMRRLTGQKYEELASRGRAI